VTLSRAAALLGLAALCACAAGSADRASDKPAAASPPVDAFYPLKLGNEWTYEVTSGGKSKRDTVRIVGQQGPWFLDDHRGRYRMDDGGLRDPDRYLLRAPLQMGAKWTAVEDLVVQRFEVIAVDASEVTPAGTFLRCVTVRNEQPLGPQRGTFVTEWTYAPGVGLVRLRTTVSKDGQTLPQVTAALVEYRVQQ
jgi:hypothetical protein